LREICGEFFIFPHTFQHLWKIEWKKYLFLIFLLFITFKISFYHNYFFLLNKIF
jgi:hypothetical protein